MLKWLDELSGEKLTMLVHETKIADTPVKVIYEDQPEFVIHDIIVTNEEKERYITKHYDLILALTKEIKNVHK